MDGRTALLLACTLLVAGCLGDSAASRDGAPHHGGDAAAVDPIPVLMGRITTAEGTGIPNATVRLVGHDARALTNATGWYAFADVPRDVILGIAAEADGYISYGTFTRVPANTQIQLDMRLEAIPVPQPRIDADEHTFFFGCHATGPEAGPSIGACPTDPAPEPWHIPVQADNGGIVIEAFWSQTSPGSDQIRLELDGPGDAAWSATGGQGVAMRLPASMAGDYRLRVTPAGEHAGLMLQQEVEVVASLFYLQEAPAAYSVTGT